MWKQLKTDKNQIPSTSSESSATSPESRRRRLGEGNINESLDLRLPASESGGTMRKVNKSKICTHTLESTTFWHGWRCQNKFFE